MEFKLETYHRNTPDEKLLEDIQNVALKLKKNTVTISEYKEHGKFHPSTLMRKLGSWYKVLELAKLEASYGGMNILEEELFENIEGIWISLGTRILLVESSPPADACGVGNSSSSSR